MIMDVEKTLWSYSFGGYEVEEMIVYLIEPKVVGRVCVKVYYKENTFSLSWHRTHTHTPFSTIQAFYFSFQFCVLVFHLQLSCQRRFNVHQLEKKCRWKLFQHCRYQFLVMGCLLFFFKLNFRSFCRESLFFAIVIFKWFGYGGNKKLSGVGKFLDIFIRSQKRIIKKR